MKKCNTCRQLLPEDDFYIHRRDCKSCIVNRQREVRSKPGNDINRLFKKWGRA